MVRNGKKYSWLLFAVLTFGAGFADRALAVGRQQLHGHVPADVSRSAPGPRLEEGKHLWLAIALPWRNQTELANLIKDIYDKSSPEYHHYLTNEQFTQRFGPTREDYQAVQEFLASKGLTVKNTHSNRLLVDADGTVGDIEKAFNVEIHQYTRQNGSTFYAPDREPSLDLDTPIDYIHGLDNANPPHPLYKKRPENVSARPSWARGAGSQGVTADFNGSGTGGCEGCYVGNDFRDAYAPGVTLTGTGVNSAVLCDEAIVMSDITTYESMFNLPNVPISIVAVDDYNPNTTLSSPNGENSLDIEQQISMAPGLNTLYLYMGSQSIDDDLNTYATQNVAKTISISYGWGPDTTINSIAQQCGVQGQSVFIASGDGGEFSGGIGSDSAEESPYVTVVGGTSLWTTGPGGSWTAEYAWVDGGGGVANDYSIPSYQSDISMATNYGSTTNRDLPDVSMFADFGYLIYAGGAEDDYIGGTSGATPLFAAFTALANEQAAQLGKSSVGFLNPTVYSIGQSSSYNVAFHDITSGNDGSVTAYPAVPGYDLATGWGSPNGQNLINALTGVAVATATPTTSNAWRIAAGRHTSYTDCNGDVWAPDVDFNGGSYNSSGSSISKALPCTSDQALYQTEHYASGSLSYTFYNVPSGSYQVTLKFAELFDGSGDRIMNVSINGTQVLTNFDINATAGGMDIATDQVFNNVSPVNGQIVVTFAATASSPDQNAKVDALQVIPQPGVPTNTPAPATNTFTPTYTFTPTRTPTFTPTSTPVVSATWRVAGGKTTSYTDCLSEVWSPDENYSAGAFNGNSNTISKALPCTTDQSLYQTEHWGTGSFNYTFNVPSGSYQVTLKFAEIFDTAAGDRIMNVSINGVTVLTNFDIFATAGGMNIATDQVFNNIGPSNGQIVVTFAATASSPDQNAKVDALQVIPQPPTPTFTFTATKTATSTATSTNTSTATSTSTHTASPTPTNTWTPTFTFTSTRTNTPVPPTPTFTLVNTPTVTSTPTDTWTPTFTFTATRTNSPVPPTATLTVTNSSTPVPPTATFTYTNTATATNTPTNTWTPTYTFTPTRTNSPVPPTATFTVTNSSTPVPPTATFTYTNTATATNTPTNTWTPTSTFTPTNTATNTPTPTAIPTTSSACAGVPAWNGNFTPYSVGQQVTYNGGLYQCIQAHTSEPNWTPPATPALWEYLGSCSGGSSPGASGSPCAGAPAWSGNGVAYSAGQEVTYNGSLYQCIQAHVSEPTWTPAATPALWNDLGACSGAVVSSATVSKALVYPDPIRGGNATLYYQIQGDGTAVNPSVVLRIYTETGRLIWSQAVAGADTAPGDHRVTWDVRDLAGVPLANGLYYYTATVSTRNQKNVKRVPLLVLR